MQKNMEILLSKIGEIQKKQIIKQTEACRRGEDFNVFNIVGLWSEEVRLHSAMLAELLNPTGSHGCREAFLKKFIEEVVKYKIPDNINGLEKVITTTEYYIGQINDKGTEGGRLDILIEIPQELGIPSLIIENKIYANDQPNQLLRYYHFANKRFSSPAKFKILYLTLYGDCPSELSTGKDISFEYTCISYAQDIMKWLGHCAAIAYDKPKVRETIIQYQHLLNQITAYYMNENNPIVKEITTNEEYLKNAILICSYRNNIIKEAILIHIIKALEFIKEKAEQQTNLEIKFITNGFNEKGGELDWSFSYDIEKEHKTVRLHYKFANWGLKGLFYGIKKDGTKGIKENPIFKNTSPNWPMGWDWVSTKYINWTGESLYNMIEELSDRAYEHSSFCKNILNNILTASTLLDE